MRRDATPAPHRTEIVSGLIGKKRGIQLLTQLMGSASEHVQLQADCSATIANLASLEANRTTMLSYNHGECITLILGNLGRFAGHLHVQVEICATLANIASHEGNAAFIVARGGIAAILEVMQRHPEHADVLVQSYHALAALGRCGKEELVKEDFGRCILMPSLERHAGEQEVLSGRSVRAPVCACACVHALWRLSNRLARCRPS